MPYAHFCKACGGSGKNAVVVAVVGNEPDVEYEVCIYCGGSGYK